MHNLRPWIGLCLLLSCGVAAASGGQNAPASAPLNAGKSSEEKKPEDAKTREKRADEQKSADAKPDDGKPADGKPDAAKKELVAPDIHPEAIWDGHLMVPFHAIDNPKMVAAKDADFLDAKEYVLGLTINGEARAYPTRFVWWHHFVNDKTTKAGPEYPAFVVTYCSVCNSGIRFDPRVDGKPLLFDFYGLYNGVAIMSDRDTQSVWFQVEGRAVKGPRTGKTLKSAPLLDTTWEQWKQLHPDTLVMSPDNEYKAAYRDKDKPEPRGYSRFPAPFFASSLTRRDKRLPDFDKVLAVRLPKPEAPNAPKEGEWNENFLSRAYPIADLKTANGVVNDMLGTTPVAAFLDLDTVTANAVSRVLDGKTLTFESRKDGEKSGIYDKETGTRWNIEGVGETGPMAGKSLTRLDSHLSQWYGWVAYYPKTSIYGRNDPPQTENLPAVKPDTPKTEDKNAPKPDDKTPPAKPQAVP